MPLDPQVREYFDKIALLNLPRFEQVEPAEARRVFIGRQIFAGSPEEVESVENRTLPGGIPVRVYRPVPKPTDTPGARRAGLVYFHGGGWLVGNLDTIDIPCRTLANSSGRVVISVDYRLAPEFKYPVPLDDCWAATKYAMTHADELGIDPKRLAVGGDSAGGNLAAAVCLRARDREPLPNPLDFQLLIYPVADAACDTGSYRDFAEGFGLSAVTMRYCWNCYLERPEQGNESLVSPLRAKNLSGLPPALVVLAEFDVLRDEGEAYAAKLREAGIRVEIQRFDGLIHGFLTLAGVVDRAKLATKQIGESLARE